MEKWDHESLQARLQDCPSVFEDEIFHRLSNRKARKGDSFLVCDSAFVQRVGGKNFTKKFPSIFQDTLGQVFKRSIASVWQNRVLIKRFSVAERFYVNTMFREQFQESKWRRLENHLSFLNNPLRKRSWVPKTSKAAVYVRVRYNNRPIFVHIYFISMLTHVENVVNKNWLQKLSHLLRLSVIDQTRHQNVVKQYAGLCDTLAYRAHTPQVCSFWSRLKASKGVFEIDRRQLDVYLFAFLPSDFANVFRKIVTSVETLSRANLFVLGYGEKASPSPAGIDVRRKHAWCRCCWYPIFGHFPFCLTHWS